MLERWGMQGYPVIAIVLRSTRPGEVANHRVLSMGQTELNRGFES